MIIQVNETLEMIDLQLMRNFKRQQRSISKDKQ